MFQIRQVFDFALLTIAVLTSGCGPAWISPPSPMYPPGHGPQSGQTPFPPPSELGQPTAPPTTFETETTPGSLKEVPTVPADQVLRFPSVPSNTRHHRVVAGDTITSIAQQYGVTVDGFRAANGIGPDGKILVGELLRIPRADD